MLWLVVLIVVLFALAVMCVFAAIWQNDGPIWAGLFVLVIVLVSGIV